MSGRVTIRCAWGSCGSRGRPAVEVHWNMKRESLSPDRHLWWWPICAVHVQLSKEQDESMMKHGDIAWYRHDALINPGTCSESDVLAVECAMDAIARLLRRDEADVARLRAAAEAVKGRYYVPCWKGPPDRSCRIGGYRCERCNGTGLVLRRRSDGTAVIDEIDAGSVAA